MNCPCGYTGEPVVATTEKGPMASNYYACPECGRAGASSAHQPPLGEPAGKCSLAKAKVEANLIRSFDIPDDEKDSVADRYAAALRLVGAEREMERVSNLPPAESDAEEAERQRLWTIARIELRAALAEWGE